MNARMRTTIDRAEGIRSFRFEPEQDVVYAAGQWTTLTLDGMSHDFTLSSSPTEPTLEITTTMRGSEYKQRLGNLKTGDTVQISQPRGSFTPSPKDRRGVLFLAGGIGITPFISVVRLGRDVGWAGNIHLMHAIKNAQVRVFGEELEETQKQHRWLKVTTNMTGERAQDWAGEVGRIDEAEILRVCPDALERSWWICGAAAFVDAYMEIAKQMGVVPEQIKTEDFPGY